MKVRYFPLLILFIAAVLVSCGGGDKTSLALKPAAAGKVENNVTLNGFPHTIDFLVPSSPADKAIIFLHGGGGENYEFAYNLGIDLVDQPPTVATIDWDWLNTNKILAVFPQGQAVPDAPLAFTWDNHVTVSGQDDTAFLEALASYVKSQYSVSHIYIVGHSSGGMMVNRMWCEAPGTFDAYISISGPASSYYLDPATPCSPSVIRPYYGIVGGEDDVLNVSGNWDKQTWVMTPQRPDSAAYVNTVLIGEWYQQVTTRAPLMCNETPVLGDGVDSGGVETWTNCDGRLELQEIALGGHSIDSLETASGLKMRDLAVSFIDQLQ